jgi:hypothetical protein
MGGYHDAPPVACIGGDVFSCHDYLETHRGSCSCDATMPHSHHHAGSRWATGWTNLIMVMFTITAQTCVLRGRYTIPTHGVALRT